MDSTGTTPLPEEVEAFIGRIVNSVRYRPDVAQHVYDELAAHFSDALEDIGNEVKRSARASELMESFGDPVVLGNLIRDAKRRSLGERGINFSAVGGLFTFLLVIFAAVGMGGYVRVFINIASFILCAGCVAGLSIMTLGFRGFFEALFAIRVLCVFVPPHDIGPTCPYSLRVMIKNTYTALALAGGIGGIQCLAVWNEPPQIGAALAFGLVGMLYCVTLAEGILRPTLIRVKGLSRQGLEGAEATSVQGNK